MGTIQPMNLAGLSKSRVHPIWSSATLREDGRIVQNGGNAGGRAIKEADTQPQQRAF
jgi:hypothetical protein